jgi:hypothetical protein
LNVKVLIDNLILFLENIGTNQSFIVDFELGIGFESKEKHFVLKSRSKDKKLLPRGRIFIFNFYFLILRISVFSKIIG